jgi:hypothetical protein
MRTIEHLSRNGPAGSHDRAEQDRKQAEEDSARRENAARYKENVEQVNRARDRDMERGHVGVRKR